MSAGYILSKLAEKNAVKALKELLSVPGLLDVDGALNSEYQFGIMEHLAENDQIEFAQRLFRDVALFVRAGTIRNCIVDDASLEFMTLLLQYRVTDATCWSSPSDMEHIPALVRHVVFNYGIRMLRLLIEHELPPTPHEALYSCARLRTDKVGPSIEVVELLIEHANQHSRLFKNFSFIQFLNHWPLLEVPNPRPDVVQLLREMPSDKIYSWVKTVHPTHTSRNEECSLCYDTYNTGERIVKLPCGHIFHLECMLPVADYSRQDNCPYCRQRYI